MSAPERFGPYEILEPLGEGAMGVVYLARDPRLGRRVALKRIRPEALHDSSRARFDEEIRAAGRLRHRGIVRVLEVGRVDGQPYYTMDLVVGRPLDQVLEEERLGPIAAARLVLEVARALDHAHGQGVVHRDVKPSNVLVDEEYNPRLVDFGLAKRMVDSAGLTRSGMIIGTPQYLAPEQMDSGFGAIGPVTDVYGLGGLLFACLTGQPPNAGESEVEIFYRLTTEKAPSARRIDPRVPARLDGICRRALARETKDRTPGAAEMAERLEAFLLQAADGAAERPGFLRDPLHWLALVGVAAALVAIGWLAFGRTVPSPVEGEIARARGELQRALADDDLDGALGSLAVLEALGDDVAAGRRRTAELAGRRRRAAAQALLDEAVACHEAGDDDEASALAGLAREVDPALAGRAEEVVAFAGAGPVEAVGGPEGGDRVAFGGWRYQAEQLEALGLRRIGDEWLAWPELVRRGLAEADGAAGDRPAPLRFRLAVDGTVEWIEEDR